MEKNLEDLKKEMQGMKELYELLKKKDEEIKNYKNMFE